VVCVLASALRLLDSDRTYRRLRVTLRPEAPAIWAAAHPAGLVFVALHLARNARDATARVRSPRLTVSAYPSDDQIVIEFADNGSGLCREDLNCAFSPLLGKGGRTEHTGVGLATCHQLVRHMGGKIRLLSRPPKGTTVVVTLPAATPPA
jgi:two-component system, sporulation sensor kinase D